LQQAIAHREVAARLQVALVVQEGLPQLARAVSPVVSLEHQGPSGEHQELLEEGQLLAASQA
jgi:hypothetical protein